MAVVCPTCQRDFQRPRDLEQHQLTHTGFPCPRSQCQAKFNTEKEKTTHVNDVHDGFPVDCPRCLRPFKRQRSLRDHEEKGFCQPATVAKSRSTVTPTTSRNSLEEYTPTAKIPRLEAPGPSKNPQTWTLMWENLGKGIAKEEISLRFGLMLE